MASDAGAAGRPWIMAVTSTTGSPMSRRTTANGNTQSGNPMLSLSKSTTWRTTQDAPIYTASTRHEDRGSPSRDSLFSPVIPVVYSPD